MNIRKDPAIRRMLEGLDSDCNELYQANKPEKQTSKELRHEGIPLIITLILVLFIAGISAFAFASGNPEKTIIINNTIDNSKIVQEIPIYQVTQEYKTENKITCEAISPSATSCFTSCGKYFFGNKEITYKEFQDNCKSQREWREI